MKPSWKRPLGSAVFAILAFTVVTANVQARPATRGHFALPYEAQWGSVTLPAGDYTFSIDHLSMNGSILLYRGTQAAGMVRWQSMDEQSGAASGELLCIRHDGKATVRALKLPEVGTLYFSLPRDMKTLVAQQPELIETVAVQVAGE